MTGGMLQAPPAGQPLPAAGAMPQLGTGSRRSWTRRDTGAAALLAGAPAVLLSVAAAVGYPLMTGDDVAQSYPLSVLAGRVMRHGHLPLFDSWLWSGSPLLGGANAHPFLPLSLLFVVLPPLAAWVAGEVAVVAGAAIGCQVLLRRTECASLPAALGGAAFGLAGFVSSQLVHIDFAAAAAALPWAAVALGGIATTSGRARPRHALLLAACAGWVTLSGSPDIVVDAGALGLLYLGHLLAQPLAPGRRAARRSSLVAWSIAGTASGIASGALQWWPAADFVAVSQRAHPGLSFLGAGSASASNLLIEFVPHLLGGGPIGLSRYTSGFPLAEINAYPGIVALVSLAVLTARWRAPDAWRWRVWILVAAVGVLLALGGHTPIDRLLARLPVVGQQRLPSRALILVALSSAMALGHFLDGLWSARPEWRLPSSVAAGCLPIVVVLGTVLATVVSGRPAGGALHPLAGRGWSLAAVAPALGVSAALALGATAILVLMARAPSGAPRRDRRVARLAVALVIVDLVVFDANQSSLAPIRAEAIAGPTAADRTLARLVGTGRYLVIDPSLNGGPALDEVGSPDLSVLGGIPSAEGYGSLTWGPYAAATGTHSQASVLPAALSNGVFASLGVNLVLVWPEILHDSRHVALARALEGVGWVAVGRVGGFLGFRSHVSALPFGGSPVQVLSSSPWTGAATVLVSAAGPTTLVRSMAAIPGWQATERPAGSHSGTARLVPVRPDGLVQSVRAPAGRTVVTFSYVPPGWHEAQWAALAGALGCLLLAGLGAVPVAGLASRSRRRRTGRLS
jgi:hypothetical protein